jgi:hypothetical protein
MWHPSSMESRVFMIDLDRSRAPRFVIRELVGSLEDLLWNRTRVLWKICEAKRKFDGSSVTRHANRTLSLS